MAYDHSITSSLAWKIPVIPVSTTFQPHWPSGRSYLICWFLCLCTLSLTHCLEVNSLRTENVLVRVPPEADPETRIEAKCFIQDVIPGCSYWTVRKYGSETKKRRQPMNSIIKRLSTVGTWNMFPLQNSGGQWRGPILEVSHLGGKGAGVLIYQLSSVLGWGQLLGVFISWPFQPVRPAGWTAFCSLRGSPPVKTWGPWQLASAHWSRKALTCCRELSVCYRGCLVH